MRNKDFDEYSNFDDRGLQSQSSATKSNNSNSPQPTSKEEYGTEKNPLMEKIKSSSSSILKKVEKFINDNK